MRKSPEVAVAQRYEHVDGDVRSDRHQVTVLGVPEGAEVDVAVGGVRIDDFASEGHDKEATGTELCR